MNIDDDSKTIEFVLLNDYVLRQFEKISADSGFRDKHVASREGEDSLIKNGFRGSVKRLTLEMILDNYLLYVMRHAAPNNEYHNKVRKILDNKEVSLKNYLRGWNKIEKEELQVFCVLALGIFYFFLARNMIHILIEKLDYEEKK